MSKRAKKKREKPVYVPFCVLCGEPLVDGVCPECEKELHDEE